MSENQSMTQQAYVYMKNAIYNCRYLPGQSISEKQLYDDIPYGRTPIRESLLQLQQEGLIEIFPRKGMRIVSFSEEMISDLYQIRKLIEPVIAVDYCPLYSRKKLLQFQQQLHTAMEKADDKEFYTLDIEFHTYLVSMANNRRLSSIFSDIMWHQYRLAIYAAMMKRTEKSKNGPEHDRIILALLSEDREEIRSSITSHINNSMIAMISALE